MKTRRVFALTPTGPLTRHDGSTVLEYTIAQLEAGGAVSAVETLNVPSGPDLAFDHSGDLWALDGVGAIAQGIAVGPYVPLSGGL